MFINRRGMLVGGAAGLVATKARALSHGLATPPTVGLVTSGDSITGCSNDYPFQALANPTKGDCGVPSVQATQTYYSRAASSVPIMWRNMAIAGTRLNSNGFPDLVPLAPVYIDPIVGTHPFKGLELIFVTAIGSNDACIGGLADAPTYAAAVATCCVARKTAGYSRIAMSTVLPRGDGTMTQGNWASFNSTITGNGWAAANGIDYIIVRTIVACADLSSWCQYPYRDVVNKCYKKLLKLNQLVRKSHFRQKWDF